MNDTTEQTNAEARRIDRIGQIAALASVFAFAAFGLAMHVAGPQAGTAAKPASPAASGSATAQPAKDARLTPFFPH